MAEQTVDLRATLATLRRHLLVLSFVAVVGAAGGAALAWTNPPEYTSRSLVLLPPVQDSSGQALQSDIQTDLKVAGSSVVLGPAGASLDPEMTAAELARKTEVVASTGHVLEFVAWGSTAADARARAQAVAESQVEYTAQAQSSLSNAQEAALAERRGTLEASLATVKRQMEATRNRLDSEPPASRAGRADASALAQLTAQQADLALQIDRINDQQELQGGSSGARIIQEASGVRRTGLVPHVTFFAAGGAVAALLLAAIVLAMLARGDRRVRYRDEMADALGSPVLASVGSEAARSVAGWTSLMQAYEPSTVDAWALRQVLRGLIGAGGADVGPERRPATRSGKTTVRRTATVLLVALGDDTRALAVGPQLASYAASVGVRTRLHAAQRHESAAALWAACHRGAGQEEVRPGLFTDTGSSGVHEPELTVVVAVLDRQDPVLSVSPDVDRALFAVSPGAVTAEDIARAAVAADDAGCMLSGLVVADPDDLDRTTGRMLQHERAQQVPLPARVTGAPAPGGGPSGTIGRPG